MGDMPDTCAIRRIDRPGMPSRSRTSFAAAKIRSLLMRTVYTNKCTMYTSSQWRRGSRPPSGPAPPGADHHLFISPYFKIEPLLDEQVSVCKNTCGGETAGQK